MEDSKYISSIAKNVLGSKYQLETDYWKSISIGILLLETGVSTVQFLVRLQPLLLDKKKLFVML